MIVALETSSTDLSIALAELDGTLIATDAWAAGTRHASELLPRLVALAASAGRPLAETRLVAVGDGPGSFTGLRIGMSVAKALAFSVRCAIVPVPSLAAWLDGEPDAGVAASRAGATESYVQWRHESEPHVMPHETISERLREAAAVCPGELAAALGLRRARPPFRAAAALALRAARIGRQRVPFDPVESVDDLDAIDALEPRYLRAPRGAAAVPRHD